MINLEIPEKDFEDFRNAHHEVADSNSGIGIDIIEDGILNKIKFNFKKHFN
ncbi:hypothetical protein [uncultured Flavobacterium sp.]|uniref:hypothetical protein n=1 Tax=uncultured Flavobacterium sp. TaxID=165435 RepID=UPI003081D3FA